MDTITPAPVLHFDKWESARCNKNWKACCGHHSLAAVCGVPLEEIRKTLTHTKGWMSPTNIQTSLERLGYSTLIRRPKNNTRELLPGINRIQFEGPWMLLSDPKIAYHHTHWVGARDGWVMDTVVGPFWIPYAAWLEGIGECYNEFPQVTGWHVTHVYELQRRAAP